MPLEEIKIDTVCIENSSLIYILIAIIKINKTHSFSLVFRDIVKPYQVVASSSLFRVFVCETNWVRCSIFWSLVRAENEKRKEIDFVVCGAGDRKSQEFMDGCKLTVIMLKCVRLFGLYLICSLRDSFRGSKYLV